MRPTVRPAFSVFSAVMLVVAASCSAGKDAETLCRDLVHLHTTIALAAEPGPDALVGEVRGALHKLSPTIEAAEGSGQDGGSAVTAFADAQDAYLDALDGFGDDEPIATVASAPAKGMQLAAAAAATEKALGCLAAPSSPTGSG